jgi:hypothetical protein
MSKAQALTLAALIIVMAITCLYLIFRTRKSLRNYPPDEVESINERNTMAVAMRCFETGKPVVGDVDDDGNLTMREL